MEKPSMGHHFANVNGISAKQLTGALDKIAKGKLASGQSVIFINKRGDMAQFENKGLAEKEGFRKLKYQDIVKISKEVLQKEKNVNDKFELGKKLNELTVRKEFKLAEKYTGLNPLKQVKGHLKKGAVKEAVKAVRTSGASGYASPAQLQKLDEKMGTVKHVERSQGGVLGVIFLKSEAKDGEKVVMKFISHSSGVKLAEHLYQKANFLTANCYFVPRYSEDGRADQLLKLGERTTITILDKPGQPPITPENRQIMIQKRQEGINFAMKFHEDVQVSEDVHAISFNDDAMGPDRFTEVMNDPVFVRDLGRLAMYDAFMGNDDRMQPWTPKPINFGNIMVKETDQGNRLVLIDNEAKISSESSGVHALALQVLFEGKDGVNIDSYFSALMSRFKMDLPVNKEKFMAAFKEGAMSAAREIIASFPSETEFKVWEQISGADANTIDIPQMQKNINYMKQHLK
jgi:hypothetical protein